MVDPLVIIIGGVCMLMLMLLMIVYPKIGTVIMLLFALYIWVQMSAADRKPLGGAQMHLSTLKHSYLPFPPREFAKAGRQSFPMR